MQKRILGKTGEEVSILGFGAMRLPVLDSGDQTSIDEPAATAMIRSAIDGGVNYLDTAWPYHRAGDINSPGVSEPFLGKVLRDGYREKVKVATKLPVWIMRDKAQMHKTLDLQLERLGLTQIDFYLAHNLNRTVWPAVRDMGLFEFFDEARKDGRINHVGFSFHDNYRLFSELLDAYDWEFTQIQYNYLDTEFQAGRKGLELAAAKGLGVVVMEPLRGGFLTMHMPDEMRRYLAGIRPGWTLAEWGLRWLWDQPEVGVVLSGMSTMDQVTENMSTAANFQSLNPAEREALATVREHFLSRIKVNCTGCGYCLPCPSGVNIPRVFAIYNDYFMVDTEANHGRVRGIYGVQVRANEPAGLCVSCGACEPKCPQGLAISREMPEAAAIFGR